MISWDDVTTVAPELSAVPTDTRTAILADVALQISVTAWGGSDRADMASKYLAAHLGTLALGGANGGGPVVSEVVGQVSRSYASPMGNTPGSEGSTRYGLEFMRLRRALVMSRAGFTG